MIIRITSRILQLLYFLYALLLFLVLLIPVFLLAVLASLAGSIKGGNLIYRICTAWADIWFLLVGIHHENIMERPLQEGQPYIFVANHISYLDAALIVKVFRKPLRPLGKAEMSKIPLFGYIYRKAVVTVDRSSAINRGRSIGRLKAVLRKDISVLVFPEGTFNETHQPLKSFYPGAFRIAVETQTPIKPVIFLDMYDRMPYDRTLKLTPGKSRAVFLEEVPVHGYNEDNIAELSQKVFSLMEEALIRYRASWITENIK